VLNKIMSAVILNGQELADKIKSDLAKKIFTLNKKPGLAVVLVGDNEASVSYIKRKEKACLEVGINFHKYLCPDNISEKELAELIEFLNKDIDVDGILLQLPLPKGFETQAIIDLISKDKDVDGFFSSGASEQVTPPTIAAIMELLKYTNEDLTSKKTLVIANSDIYTAKLDKYLSVFGIASVSRDSKIPDNCADYDIVIIALGQPNSLQKEMIKKEAIIIDVGINKLNGQIVGDADDSVKEVAAFVSPVPGGVGPLTVACLLKNVLEINLKLN